MTHEEAKEILLLYRPGTPDAEEPEIIQAMEVARSDAELGRWFQQHQSFQAAVRARFRQLEAPEHIKLALLSRSKIILPVRPVPWWQTPVWLTAAAAMVAIVATLTFWPRQPKFDRFADYQQMMVSKAANGYAMDWPTGDMQQLRSNIKQRGAPADYALTPALEKLKLTGGATFLWRNNPVAMVCFNRGDGQMIFLFVLKSAALKDPPPGNPKLDDLNNYTAASWTQGDNAYVLAGPREEGSQEFLKRYF
jgi:hypothetical protein